MIMGEMEASIAHEVNQPLTAVVTNANACSRLLAGKSPDLDDVREAFIRLAPSQKLHYAGPVASGVFPPHPLSVVPVTIQILVSEGWRMTRKNTWARLAVAVVLSLPLTACKDTKTLQENEQLKAHVAELQKENGQLGNNLETMTASRDALSKENEALKAGIKARKTKRSGTKVASRKRRRR
jgi:FtsZ-binding cell division protein ZapB